MQRLPPADLARSGRGGAWRMPTTTGGAPRDAPAGIVRLSGHVGDLLCCSHVAPCAARDMEDSVAVLRTRHGRTPWRPNATAGRDTDEPALDVVARSEGGQRSGSGAPATGLLRLRLGGRRALGPPKPKPAVPVGRCWIIRYAMWCGACAGTHWPVWPRMGRGAVQISNQPHVCGCHYMLLPLARSLSLTVR